jgi:single-stranded-DNA-specific exonuclease
VVDRTATPALVLTHEDTEAHGSGRSIEGFHLLDALTAVHEAAPIFTRFGGHAHAVGFSLPSEHVPDLRTRLAAYADIHRRTTPQHTTHRCDAELRLSDITPDFLTALEQLGPFGNANPEPLFLTRNVRLAGALKVIKDRHLRLTVEDPDDGARMAGMAWSRRTSFTELARTHSLDHGSPVDLVYRLHHNHHPDFGGWELEILALRPATV